MPVVDKEKPNSKNELLKEDEFTVKYPPENSSENYIIRIQLFDNEILISAKENNNLVQSFYDKKFNVNDFHKLLGNFSVFYKTIDDIYNFLLYSLRDKEMFISSVMNKVSLTLTTELKAKYKDPLKVEIKLLERKCNKEKLVDSLCNEIKDLKEEVSKVKNENNKLKEQILNKKDIKIQSGEYDVKFLDKVPKMYTCNNLKEFREFIDHINFDEEYEKKPQIMVSLSGMDIGNDHNTRIRVFAENINTSGFDIRIFTWSDTQVYGVKVSWISFG